MKLLKILLFIFIALIILAGGGYFYLQNYYNNAINDKSGSQDIVEVTIPAGSSSETIGKILKDAKLIDSEFIFQLYLRRSNQGGQLKAGSYEFFENQSVVEIVAELTKGAQEKGVKVTLPEGLRYDEVVKTIVTRYQDAGLDNIDETELVQIVEQPDRRSFNSEVRSFLKKNKPAGKNLEGFLYPDTYEFAKTASEEEIITKILANFVTKAKTLPEPEGMSFYEYLTLASIVEREALGDKEDEEIAGIFIRRINTEDRIGADATVLYPYKRWKPEPTQKELNTDTPYNTRFRTGLPPTPIASPGLSAMKGTWNVEESKYYYFIHDSKGNTYFAKTLDEHNANIRKYLQ